MNTSKYMHNVLARASNTYHKTKAPFNRMIALMYKAKNYLDGLDEFKKAVFYGRERTFDKTSDSMSYVEACELNPFPDMPSHRVQLMHGTLGIATEVAELLERHLINLDMGEPLDEVNMKEELGDLLWYIALSANALGTTLDELMAVNDAKLEKRFGAVFSEDAANNRDLVAERAILEGNGSSADMPRLT